VNLFGSANPIARWGESVRSQPIATLLTAALIALLAGGLLWPIGMAIYQAFVHRGSLSGYWFSRLLHDRTGAQLLNGLQLASLATGISLVLAVPLALVRARCRFVGQKLLGVAVLVPLILPPFVGAMSMRQLLGQFGVLNLILERLGLLEIGPGELPPDWLAGGMVGVAVIQALHLFPILYLNASASLANVDPSHTQAARNLGAGPMRTFLRVTLPLIRPGLFAGGTIVFIWSFTDIGTPLIMSYTDLLPVRIFQELSSTYGGKTFAMVFVLLAISVGLYVLGKFVFGRSEDVAGSKATLQAETRKLGPLATVGAWALFGLVLVAAILPHVGVVLTALADSWINTIVPTRYTTAHLQAVVTSEETYRSILNSLKYAGTSTVIDLGIGTLAAWLIVRSRSAGSGLLDALAMLPLAVPGLILAAGYVAMTVPGSLLDRMGITPVDNPFVLLVIAYSVRRLPFVVRGVSAGLQQVPVSLEEAARNLGSSRAGAARRITLPLVTANLIAAGVLTFSFAMLEVSDSLVLAQRASDYPITKQIYILYTSGTAASANVAAALGVYGMGLLATTMAVASILLGRKLGAIFRA
jgi:iron(III) transport system permease protein